MSQLYILIFLYFLVLLSKINFFSVFKKSFFISLIFGFGFSFFAIFNFITPGKEIFLVYKLKSSFSFFSIYIPQDIYITLEGLGAWIRFGLRVFNFATLSMIIVHSVELTKFFSSLKFIGIPDFIILIFILCLKYIVILSYVIEETYMARKSRVIITSMRSERQWLVSKIAFIFIKAMERYEDIFDAMIARGFRGKVIMEKQKLPLMNEWIFLLFCFMFYILI